MAKLTTYGAVKSAAGDNTIVAAPGAGLRIVPVFLFSQNATATADTGYWYSGPSATGTLLAGPVLMQNQGEGLVANTVFEDSDSGKTYQVKCGENEALVFNKAQAVGSNIFAWYYIESVFGVFA
jgi:hypothetical protein